MSYPSELGITATLPRCMFFKKNYNFFFELYIAALPSCMTVLLLGRRSEIMSLGNIHHRSESSEPKQEKAGAGVRLPKLYSNYTPMLTCRHTMSLNLDISIDTEQLFTGASILAPQYKRKV